MAVVGLAGCGAASPAGRAVSTSSTASTASTASTTAPSSTSSSPHLATAPRSASVTTAPSTRTGTSPASGDPAPAVSGTYLYKQSGTQSAAGYSQAPPASGTEVIDAKVAGAGGWEQTWHQYASSQAPPDDITYLFSRSGVAVVSEVLRIQAFGGTSTYTCTMSSPVLIIDWPVEVGYRFAGTGNCGSFTISISGQIAGTHAAQLDGSTTPTYVVESTVTTKGQIDSTTDETDWIDVTRSLIVHSDATTKGTYGSFSFQSQLTRDLESATPSSS